MWEDAMMIVKMQNTEYTALTCLHIYFLYTLPSPAWHAHTCYNQSTQLPKIQVTMFRQHYSHISWYKYHSYMLLTKFKTSLHVFICLPGYLQVLFLKTDCPQSGNFFHQHHKNSGRTLKPTLEMHSASSRLFATHFPILVLEISKKQTSLLYCLDWQTQRSLNAEVT